MPAVDCSETVGDPLVSACSMVPDSGALPMPHRANAQCGDEEISTIVLQPFAFDLHPRVADKPYVQDIKA